eukprot:gene794-biopygen843
MEALLLRNFPLDDKGSLTRLLIHVIEEYFDSCLRKNGQDELEFYLVLVPTLIEKTKTMEGIVSVYLPPIVPGVNMDIVQRFCHSVGLRDAHPVILSLGWTSILMAGNLGDLLKPEHLRQLPEAVPKEMTISGLAPGTQLPEILVALWADTNWSPTCFDCNGAAYIDRSAPFSTTPTSFNKAILATHGQYDSLHLILSSRSDEHEATRFFPGRETGTRLGFDVHGQRYTPIASGLAPTDMQSYVPHARVYLKLLPPAAPTPLAGRVRPARAPLRPARGSPRPGRTDNTALPAAPKLRVVDAEVRARYQLAMWADSLMTEVIQEVASSTLSAALWTSPSSQCYSTKELQEQPGPILTSWTRNLIRSSPSQPRGCSISAPPLASLMDNDSQDQAYANYLTRALEFDLFPVRRRRFQRKFLPRPALFTQPYPQRASISTDQTPPSHPQNMRPFKSSHRPTFSYEQSRADHTTFALASRLSHHPAPTRADDRFLTVGLPFLSRACARGLGISIPKLSSPSLILQPLGSEAMDTDPPTSSDEWGGHGRRKRDLPPSSQQGTSKKTKFLSKQSPRRAATKTQRDATQGSPPRVKLKSIPLSDDSSQPQFSFTPSQSPGPTCLLSELRIDPRIPQDGRQVGMAPTLLLFEGEGLFSFEDIYFPLYDTKGVKTRWRPTDLAICSYRGRKVRHSVATRPNYKSAYIAFPTRLPPASRYTIVRTPHALAQLDVEGLEGLKELSFNSERGTGQGDIHSPFAWLAVFDVLLTVLDRQQHSLDHFHLYRPDGCPYLARPICYAADLQSFASTLLGLQRTADLVSVFAMVFKLTIATSKLRAFHYGGLSQPPDDTELLQIHAAGWVSHEEPSKAWAYSTQSTLPIPPPFSS